MDFRQRLPPLRHSQIDFWHILNPQQAQRIDHDQYGRSFVDQDSNAHACPAAHLSLVHSSHERPCLRSKQKSIATCDLAQECWLVGVKVMQVLLDADPIKRILPVNVAQGGLCILPAYVLHQRFEIPSIGCCPTGKTAPQ